MRKDKKQVIGEEITDEAIKYFLNFEPVDDTPAALYKLLRAYQGLRVNDFQRFLTFFKEQGLDLTTKNNDGKDFVALISDQRVAKPYIKAVEVAQTY